MTRVGTQVAIDALRCRSGGAIAHIRGVLAHGNPVSFGVDAVHLFSYQSLLDQIEDYPWLIKHCPAVTCKPVWQQLLWQRYELPHTLRTLGLDVLFTADASSFSRWPKHVVLHQDMLAFEPGVAQLYPIGRGGLRVRAIRLAQVYALKHATIPLFLTSYARDVVEQYAGRLPNARIVPHGIDKVFQSIRRPIDPKKDDIFEFVYVSNSAPYKNQVNVIKAIAILRTRGFCVRLRLVGALSGQTASKTVEMAQSVDPDGAIIKLTSFVDQKQVVNALTQADAFIFASECETMPVTLLEAMASGLPVLCSDRGPMPEILGNAGLYFDPACPESIAKMASFVLEDVSLRHDYGARARAAAAAFTWEQCSRLTWDAVMSAAA